MSKIKIHKKWILIAVISALLIPAVAYAADPATPSLASELDKFLQQFANLLQVILKLLQRILWPVLLTIGGLLNNDLLFSAGMEERLLGIWTQVRNFVNIGFVIILIGVAIINVLGIPSDQFSLKSILPKLIIALIAVNFSFVAMKVILDTTTLLTTAIFALPSSIETKLQNTNVLPVLTPAERASIDNAKNDHAGALNTAVKVVEEMTNDQKKKMESICRNMYGEIKDFKPTGAAYCEEELTTKKYVFSVEGIAFFSKFHSRNAAMILAIQMMNLNQVDEISNIYVKDKDGKQTKKIDMAKLTFNMLFSVILYVVYGTAYVTLFVVLLARLVILWILIALSPVMAIQLVLPNLMGSGGGLKDQFIKNTFAPVQIAAVLTIGYLMLDAYRGFNPDTGKSNVLDVLVNTSKDLQLGTSGVSTLQQLVMAFASVAVVWIGVFTVAEGTIARRAAELIRSKVGGLGWKIGSLVQHAPLMPTSGGNKSISQLWGKIESPVDKLINKWGSKGKGYKRSPSTLRGLTTLSAAKPVFADHYHTLHEVNQKKALGEALEKMKTRNPREFAKFFPTRAHRTALGLSASATPDQIVDAFKNRRITKGQMQKWLGLHGITKPTSRPGTSSSTGLTPEQTSAKPHGLGKGVTGSATTGFTGPELTAAIAPSTELSTIRTKASDYNRDKSKQPQLIAALQAYHTKLTAAGMSVDKAKKCVQDVLKHNLRPAATPSVTATDRTTVAGAARTAGIHP